MNSNILIIIKYYKKFNMGNNCCSERRNNAQSGEYIKSYIKNDITEERISVKNPSKNEKPNSILGKLIKRDSLPVRSLDLKNVHLLQGNKSTTNFNSNNLMDSQINIFIDRFELTYALFDDFGLEFTPRLTINFTSKFDRSFEIFKKEKSDSNGQVTETPDTANKCSSRSSKTDKNKPKFHSQPRSNTLKETVKEISANYSFTITEAVESKEKDIKKNVSGMNNEERLTASNVIGVFPYNANSIFNLEEMKFWESSKIKLCLSNICGNNGHTPIIIGIGFLNVSKLIKDYKKSFEGKIAIYNKYSKSVGNLFFRVKIVQDNENKDHLNVSGISDISNINIGEGEDQFVFPVDGDKEFPSNVITPLPHLHSYLLELFQNETKAFKDTKIDYSSFKSVAEMLLESINFNNDNLAYELISFINDKIDDDSEQNVQYMHQLTRILKDKRNRTGITLLDYPCKSLESKNLALIKAYFVLIHKIVIFNKKLWIDNGGVEFLMDYDALDIILIDSYEIVVNFLKENLNQDNIDTNLFNIEEKEEILEILVNLLNCMLTQTNQNLTDEQKNSEFGKKILKISFNTSLSILTNGSKILESFKLMGFDSQICSLICKIYRKSIVTIFESDNKNNISQASKSLFFTQNDKSFLNFVEICYTKYMHYPDLYCNFLMILVSVTSSNNYDIIRHILHGVKIVDFFYSFLAYNHLLKNLTKIINGYFFEFIANLTNTIESSDINSCVNKSEVKKICSEMTKIFSVKVKEECKCKYSLSKPLQKFISRKTYDIHGSLCRIAMNISKWTEGCKLLTNDKFYILPMLLVYLTTEVSASNIGSLVSKAGRDQTEIEKSIYEIVDNTLSCFIRIIKNPDTSGAVRKMINLLGIRKKNLTDAFFQISNIFEPLKPKIEEFQKFSDDNF